MEDDIWLQMGSIAVYSIDGCERGGSIVGKEPNVQRHFQNIHGRYLLRYSRPVDKVRPGTNQVVPRRSEKAFERRFRMLRDDFVRVISACIGCDGWSIDVFSWYTSEGCWAEMDITCFQSYCRESAVIVMHTKRFLRRCIQNQR